MSRAGAPVAAQSPPATPPAATAARPAASNPAVSAPAATASSRSLRVGLSRTMRHAIRPAVSTGTRKTSHAEGAGGPAGMAARRGTAGRSAVCTASGETCAAPRSNPAPVTYPTAPMAAFGSSNRHRISTPSPSPAESASSEVMAVASENDTTRPTATSADPAASTRQIAPTAERSPDCNQPGACRRHQPRQAVRCHPSARSTPTPATHSGARRPGRTVPGTANSAVATSAHSA